MSPVGSDPAPSRGRETCASKKLHNLVERVFGPKVTGCVGGDAIPLR